MLHHLTKKEGFNDDNFNRTRRIVADREFNKDELVEIIINFFN